MVKTPLDWGLGKFNEDSTNNKYLSNPSNDLLEEDLERGYLIERVLHAESAANREGEG